MVPDAGRAYAPLVADLFDVIADPTRRELLRALLARTESPEGGGEASVGQLVSELGLSQPTVSKHLKTLREFAIVSVREQGQHRYYRLEPASLEPLAEWLGAFIKPAVAAGQPVHEDAQEVVRLAPVYPLAPRARGAAVRIGATAAAVVGRLRH
ncbi:DNA-binding transcriptional ArsR family regulator [Amnibacterium kyonggiense]|uniref:DNA-binding transcriptional ArsR family regulator n=1 Tax=Amnibacterium kyonggiense TaxID=595671 RepID=A0A4R7FPJ0_9MICO|nr:DNA-binding transcriptional ArsR family regulator [Amnibacterium kyonggiense]